MTINEGYKFVFADEHCSDYGVVMASSISSSTRSGNVENRNIVQSKNLNNAFNFHGVQYDQPLTFDIIIYNEDGSWIDASKERMLKKWLLKNKMHWLKVDQADLSDIQFYCIANSAELIDVGNYTSGMKISFISSAPWAFSDLREYEYTSVGTGSFDLYTDIDFDEFVIYPQLIFHPTASGTISLTNITTSEEISFTGCINGEEIILECESDKLSSTSTNIVSRWNKKTLGIIENINEFEMTGNYSVDVKYRLPVRVGA